MKRSNHHIQSEIGVSEKDPITIPIPLSCVDTGMSSEIEGSGYHSSLLL